LGIAILATVFTSHGSYGSPQAFVAGLTPALWVGAAVLAVGALIPLVLPFSTRASAAEHAAAEQIPAEHGSAVAIPA
ncbi:MAG: MFS transporter, partial [Solirubrobacterales bacterium]|nr:MFS transporter [Solirubrobacterales bacterium]